MFFSYDQSAGFNRELVAAKYDGSGKRGPGRPRRAAEIRRLIITMASENGTWGYTRIRGALRNLGYDIGRNTIKRVLQEGGLDPAPERGRGTPWATFIAEHLGTIAAADFFSVEVLTWAGLVRFYVFFVIDIETRKVEIAGISRSPDALWMDQVARNLVDAADGFLLGKRYLILDRDPLYGTEFRATLNARGIRVLRLPAQSPDLNAYAERFVLSIKSECLGRLILLGEAHLRRAVREYMAHYHHERNHQGLANALIEETTPANTNGPVQRSARLGGLLNFYRREAA